MEVSGVTEADIEEIAFKPQVEIEVDLLQAEQFQIKPGDVRRSSATLISGLNVGNLYEEQKVFDVVVWGVPEIRNTLNDIGELLIDTPRGGHVRLEEVAEVRIVPAPMIIKRDAVSRYIDIFVTLNGRSGGTAVQDIESALDEIDFPFEYHAEILGDYSIRQVNAQRLIIVSIISAIGVYLILQAAFNSWRLAWLVVITWPFAFSGGVIGAFLTGNQYSVGSIFGFFTVLALATRTGVLILRDLENTGGTLEKNEASETDNDGMPHVFRPVLLTFLATSFIFLPVLFAGEIPGTELLQPMAAVIVGGVTTGALFNLFLLPVLYLKYRDRPDEIRSSLQPSQEVK